MTKTMKKNIFWLIILSSSHFLNILNLYNYQVSSKTLL